MVGYDSLSVHSLFVQREMSSVVESFNFSSLTRPLLYFRLGPFLTSWQRLRILAVCGLSRLGLRLGALKEIVHDDGLPEHIKMRQVWKTSLSYRVPLLGAKFWSALFLRERSERHYKIADISCFS